ncbi:hypothetical protein HJ588_18820 [Flexivirga sp. ID2601S]|uniref:Uncharacterized protein n=1 Tax=Flexivirga aerilata TaxID=1656889 RepID=A0A849ALP4_9MICO|nr:MULTISPECIES: hypothetical protein [Flexivirga]NNG41315.1 hypothetical protein [Flexivirga aerilata]
MSRRKRDLETERRDLTAAAQRLLDGTPLRSTSGRLTSTELITESGLRRDVVYGDHKNLVDDFQTRAKAQHQTPASIAQVADENRALKTENADLRRQLDAGRQTTTTLVKVATELSLELQQARAEIAQLRQVQRLPKPQTAPSK